MSDEELKFKREYRDLIFQTKDKVEIQDFKINELEKDTEKSFELMSTRMEKVEDVVGKTTIDMNKVIYALGIIQKIFVLFVIPVSLVLINVIVDRLLR